MIAVVTVDDAAAALRAIGGPWDRDRKRPEFLRQLARDVGLPVGAVKALFYRRNHLDAAERHHGEAERIKAELMKLLPPDSPLLDWAKGSEH